MKQYFYWNLHDGVWSRMVRGKVTGRFESVVMEDVEFRVRPGGRARVLREGKKNVHAFAIAEEINCDPWPFGRLGGMRADEFEDQHDWIEISYNPFRSACFVRKDIGQPVRWAQRVVLTNERRVFAQGVERWQR